MKAKVYIETTIPSYLAARPGRDLLIAAHQQVTWEWWDSRRQDFELYISEVVLNEARAGDAVLAQRRLEILTGIPLLHLSDPVLEVARSLVSNGPLPPKASGDSVHIAAATVYGCEYLLTWNCRHIANAELQRRVRRIVQQLGYDLPAICTPEELMEGKP